MGTTSDPTTTLIQVGCLCTDTQYELEMGAHDIARLYGEKRPHHFSPRSEHAHSSMPYDTLNRHGYEGRTINQGLEREMRQLIDIWLDLCYPLSAVTLYIYIQDGEILPNIQSDPKQTQYTGYVDERKKNINELALVLSL